MPTFHTRAFVRVKLHNHLPIRSSISLSLHLIVIFAFMLSYKSHFQLNIFQVFEFLNFYLDFNIDVSYLLKYCLWIRLEFKT